MVEEVIFLVEEISPLECNLFCLLSMKKKMKTKIEIPKISNGCMFYVHHRRQGSNT
jgi:hypothetical protein